jgi:hypothetical protein
MGYRYRGLQVGRHQNLWRPIDWAAVEEAMVKHLDTDGDGKLSGTDAKVRACVLVCDIASPVYRFIFNNLEFC